MKRLEGDGEGSSAGRRRRGLAREVAALALDLALFIRQRVVDFREGPRRQGARCGSARRVGRSGSSAAAAKVAGRAGALALRASRGGRGRRAVWFPQEALRLAASARASTPSRFPRAGSPGAGARRAVKMRVASERTASSVARSRGEAWRREGGGGDGGSPAREASVAEATIAPSASARGGSDSD